ncbi:MAG: hypothetical protein ACTSWN_15940 [Promethearchaeota archaeon]
MTRRGLNTSFIDFDIKSQHNVKNPALLNILTFLFTTTTKNTGPESKETI